ncbi:ISL3 family transposase [Streptococcus halotolerans]|uniref:ISL3 family transposase n=1 Tax=Streptococcus halotolerans TaxID=1814128 RepID=UPI00078767EB|nr:ISL3 family transposase [Streptococcus halotolerans]
MIEDQLDSINPPFQTVFKGFLKFGNEIKSVSAVPYSNAKLEATNHLIKATKPTLLVFETSKTLESRY